jgi:hypothetical protein
MRQCRGGATHAHRHCTEVIEGTGKSGAGLKILANRLTADPLRALGLDEGAYARRSHRACRSSRAPLGCSARRESGEYMASVAIGAGPKQGAQYGDGVVHGGPD